MEMYVDRVTRYDIFVYIWLHTQRVRRKKNILIIMIQKKRKKETWENISEQMASAGKQELH